MASVNMTNPDANNGDVKLITSLLGRHQDFPVKDILFLDIFPILLDPVAFETLISHFMNRLFSHTIPNTPNKKIDVVVGLDARGFLFGPIIAQRLGASFVPVRKPGKLPGQCVTVSYEKEYGTDSFQLQEGSIKAGQTVLVVDDLIATGGSAKAAGELVKQCGASVAEYLFVIEVSICEGAKTLDAPCYAIVKA
ncbi:phosphoribosyltransferase-like protein [Leucosporidium creatinivorum]|uniref:adenine phosphoribosyltransferase n=1 Tax=Leucosporidium creatinivorum TaxID=106004 RepID=A0A1Y2F2H5_9BASI|nr:phosphoribosyltransferase-like protein [Leucosporidium creatinivorum]